MKINRMAGVALIGVLAWGAAFAQMHGAGGQATQQMGPNQEPKNDMASGPSADQKFLEKAMESNVAEIQMGRLALEKSTDEQVRHFAMQMTEDHGKMLDDFKQAVQGLNIPVPEQPSKGALKTIEKLKGALRSRFRSGLHQGDGEGAQGRRQGVQGRGKDYDKPATEGDGDTGPSND